VRFLGVALAIVLAPSIAFARGEGPEEDTAKKPPASAMIQVTFTTSARPAAIETIACSLRPVGTVGDRQRGFDVRVGEKRCAKNEEDAIPLAIRVDEADNGRRDVTLEVAPPDEASREELEAIVGETERELQSRLEKLSRAIVTAPPPREEEDKRPKTRWYGWQILIADGSAALSCATIFLCPGGLAVYAFGPPIIHWAHGHTERGFISLGMRLAIPGVGLGIGTVVGATTCSGFFCGSATGSGALIGLAIGLITGAVLMPIIDSVGLSLEDVQPRTGVRIVPGGLEF
jgi:hypothetical protein